MNGRGRALVAWVAAVAWVTVGCLAGGLAVLNHLGLASVIAQPLAAVSFSLTGAVLIARLPGNPVGWLLMTVAVSALLLLGGGQYALYTLKTSPGSLPGGLVAAWLGGWTYAPMLAALAVWLPLVFPTGRLLSRRWRFVAWSGAAFVVLAGVGNALAPDSSQVEGIGVVRNPFATPGLLGVLNAARGVSALLLLVSLMGSITSLVVRFRRAGGVEKQQIKLVVLALAFTPVPFLAHDLSQQLSDVLFTVVLPLVPIAIAVAILRYRLYDFDRLISRTLSYTVLTALLAGIYVALVAVATRLLPTNDSLVVAGSTLAVAALFQPLRRRVQRGVDRRFNRTRYDAERTVDDFSRRLRSEVDLESVRNDLLTVVTATMQPAAAGVWLRETAEVRR